MEEPKLPESTQPPTENLVEKVVGVNLAALVLLGLVGGLLAILALPVLNIVVGVVLLVLGKKRLGLILVLSSFLVALVGLGTCALILSNVSARN
jgi:hypothetical protein